jgi:hypothetical protein
MERLSGAVISGWADRNKRIIFPVKAKAELCVPLSLEEASVTHIPHKDSAFKRGVWKFFNSSTGKTFPLPGRLWVAALSALLARLPLQLSPHSFPAESVFGVDVPVLLFSPALACACGLLFRLASAMRISRFDVSPVTQRTLHRVMGRTGNRGLNVLIAGQTALTLLIMATGATSIVAFLQLCAFPLGSLRTMS